MKKLPPEIVQELMNDEDFLGLDDAGQEEILAEVQRKLGIREPSENILQRAARGAWNVSQPNMGMTANSQFPFLPSSGPETNRLADEGMDMVSEKYESSGHPFAAKAIPIAANMLAGGLLGTGPAAKSAGGFIKNIKNPSAVFGKRIKELQGSSPNQRVDFLNIIRNAMDDPMASKVLGKSGAVEKYGGTTLNEGGMPLEKLSNLTLQDSQDLVNMVKVMVRQAVKEGTVKSNERGLAKMFSGFAGSQRGAFPGFKSAQRDYGIGKNIGKAAKAAPKTIAKGALYGAGLGSGGKIAYDFLDKLF